MQRKHTQGEWELKKSNKLTRSEVWTDSDSYLPTFQIMHNESTLQEAQANAKLIAAAPNMLDVLFKLDNLINDLGLNLPSEFLIEYQNAIEKATK